MLTFERKDFEKAQARIKNFALKTPLKYSKYLSNLNGGQVYLKCENQQRTGSVKIRGASMAILTLKRMINEFVTGSSGNHGLACGYMFRSTKTHGTVFLPINVDTAKLKKLRASGATLKFINGDQVEVEEAAKRYAMEKARMYISPYNSKLVIHAQGTLGLEILDQCPDVDYIFVTVGGGGLASGVLTAAKLINPKIKVIGCQPANSPVMMKSVEAGKIIDYKSAPSLSGGSAGGIEKGSITFDICRKGIDKWITVTEDELKKAMYVAYKYHKMVIEGAAGVAIASFMKMAAELKGKKSVVICCGGNIDPAVHRQVIQSQRKKSNEKIVEK